MSKLNIDVNSLVNFINHDLLLNRLSDEQDITEHTDLINTGVIDSLSLIQLVTYLEKQTGIQVHDADVNPDNFRSVSTIVSYLQQRTSETVPA